MTIKHYNLKPMECSKSSSNREVISNKILPQEIRKVSNKQLNLHLKQLEKEEGTKSKVSFYCSVTKSCLTL